eukprot:1190669-Prorocentrum_minimum.AAC.2
MAHYCLTKHSALSATREEAIKATAYNIMVRTYIASRTILCTCPLQRSAFTNFFVIYTCLSTCLSTLT